MLLRGLKNGNGKACREAAEGFEVKMVMTRQRWCCRNEEKLAGGGCSGGVEPTALKDGLDVKVRETRDKNDSWVSGCSSSIHGQRLTEKQNLWEDEALTFSMKVLHTFIIKYLVQDK